MKTRLTNIILGSAALLLGTGATAMADNKPTSEVFFAFDSARLESGTADSLKPIADFAKANPGMKIVLDGHTDPIGASTYNIGLSTRRAESVKDRLALMGVANNQIVIGVYGEDGLKRASYADDRRVSVWMTAKPIREVVDETLDRGTAVIWTKPVSETALLTPEQQQNLQNQTFVR
jgi:hypothetical protein